MSTQVVEMDVDVLFSDPMIDDVVNDIMELLDYMDMVDALEMTPSPPALVRQQAGPVEIVDLTGEEDLDEIPIATRLDFTLLVDELDNGGLFGSQRSAEEEDIEAEDFGYAE